MHGVEPPPCLSNTIDDITKSQAELPNQVLKDGTQKYSNNKDNPLFDLGWGVKDSKALNLHYFHD